MPKKLKINSRASNLRAKLSITPESMKEFENALKRLELAVRVDALRKAMEAGGEVIRSAAESKAPGPHIAMEIVTGAELSRGWKKSAAAQGVKNDAVYAVIGPDKKHWYYRFHEYGVKAHGITKRKLTRNQQAFRAQKVKSRDVRPSLRLARPRMVFELDGKLIFAKTVSGFASKPFLRPAVDSQGDRALKTVGQSISGALDKAAR